MNIEEIKQEIQFIKTAENSNRIMLEELQNNIKVLYIKKLRVQEVCPHNRHRYKVTVGDFDNYKHVEVCGICGKEWV